MKKIISIALALVMMMAICVPAFALDMTTPSGEATVLVDGSTMGEGSYTVTIPATINLTWGDTDVTDDYEITSQLQTAKRVKVTLEKSKDLTNDANETIAFTVADTTTGISAAAVVTDEEHDFTITIDESAWAAASIADYEGTITFTSELVGA